MGRRREFRSLRSVAREKIALARRAGGGRTGAMDLVGGTSSNPRMPRRVARPTPVPTIVGCGTGSGSGGDGRRFHPHRTRPKWLRLRGIASTTPALPLPHLRAGGRDCGHSVSFRGASPAFCTTR